MTETILPGGDRNVVVRVGDTVRRPTGPGLDERGDLVERALRQRRGGYELHRTLGGEQRLPGRREVWDGGSWDRILAGIRWLEEQREELEAWL